MNATTTRGALLAAFACVLVGGSFTANSLLGDYPYAGGQFLRYALACLLLAPWPGGVPSPGCVPSGPGSGPASRCSPASAWSASTWP